jgi:hypothetical protein
MKNKLWLLAVAAGLAGSILLICLEIKASAQQNPSPKVFGGTFSELAPEQQRLLREWAEQYSKLTGTKTDPVQLYDSARVSQRTTFDAVTHALLHTSLTDSNGRSIGTALDLVEALEQVAGQEPGARSDRQFRLYVLLKPGSFKTLSGSREFFRERDNETYHHGYPYNFRMKGTPSIQISGSRDFKRADIDVDYRSSDFPQFVFNGHLSASNSDVRAEDNVERHDGRWAGLTGWWRSLFGVVTPAQSDEQPAEGTATMIPANPRIESNQPLGTAVQDFLASLFLDQKPNLAAAYFSPKSYGCIDRRAAARHEEIGAGMTRVYLLRQLGAGAHAAGKPASLEEVVQSVSPWNPRLKSISNEFKSLFLLLSVPNDLAAVIACDTGPASELPKTEYGKYGRYYGTAFRMKVGRSTGSTVYLLWEKEVKYWKIVAFNFADSGGTLSFPVNVAPKPPAAPSLPRVQGNREAVNAMRDFLRRWFETQDYDGALAFLSPRSNACLAESGRPERQNLTPEEAGKLMQDGFQLISRAVGKRKLSKAIEPVMPSHELLRIVQHGDEDSFVVVEVPDALGDWFLCRQPERKAEPPAFDLDPAKNVYGHYYGMVFRLKVPEGEPATLQTLWALEDGRWKIIAWHTVSP